MSIADLQRWLVHDVVLCAVLLLAALGARHVLSRVVLHHLQPRPPSMTRPVLYKLGGPALMSLGLILVCFVPPAVLGFFDPRHPLWASFKHITPLSGPEGGLFVGGLFAVQSLAEELLFRGVLLALLAALFYWQTALLCTPEAVRRDPTGPAAVRFHGVLWLGSGVLASVVVAGAFAYTHHDNPNVDALALCNIGLAGFALGLVYWTRGTVAAAWVMHWAWNVLQAWLGLPVSGMALMPPPWGAGASGAVPGVLTGGAFGPEASLLCTAGLAAICAWLIIQAWRELPASGSNGREEKEIATETKSHSAERGLERHG